jgi:hypothetical protein
MAFGKFLVLPLIGSTLFGWLTYALKTAHNLAGPLFAVALVIFIVGYIRDNNETTSASADTVYAAYSLPLMGIKGATVTPAISSSTGTGVQALQAVRVRLNYAF